jgi:hypothetical protein
MKMTRSDSVVAATASAISPGGRARGLHARGAPVLLHVAEDVLVHDDGVVDHDPDREDEPSIVMLFSVKPMNCMKEKVTTMEAGIAGSR